MNVGGFTTQYRTGTELKIATRAHGFNSNFIPILDELCIFWTMSCATVSSSNRRSIRLPLLHEKRQERLHRSSTRIPVSFSSNAFMSHTCTDTQSLLLSLFTAGIHFFLLPLRLAISFSIDPFNIVSRSTTNCSSDKEMPFLPGIILPSFSYICCG